MNIINIMNIISSMYDTNLHLFKPKNLIKPISSRTLFYIDYKKEYFNKNKIRCSSKEYMIAWENLDSDKKAEYKELSKTKQYEYYAEYLKQYKEAIKKGNIPQDKPRQPVNKFLAEVQHKLTKKHANDKNLENSHINITTYAYEILNSLSDNEKVKYRLSFEKDKIEYEEKMKEWQLYENIRTGLPLDVNMIKLLIKKSKERTELIYDELLSVALHPDKVVKWLNFHLDNGGDLCDFIY